MIEEYKEYWKNGVLEEHCFYKDGDYHGEYRWWWDDEQLIEHRFFKDGGDITNEVTLLVDDIDNITDEERVLLKLKFGIDCLTNS